MKDAKFDLHVKQNNTVYKQNIIDILEENDIVELCLPTINQSSIEVNKIASIEYLIIKSGTCYV